MLFGGNFDPAYSLTITALGSQLQPVTNKRNAALLAKALQESLGVSPERGMIKFTPIAEENMATDGKTITGMIEDLEKATSETGSGLQRPPSRSAMKSKRRPSMKSLRGMRAASQLPTHNEILSPTPPISERDTPPLPAIPTEKSPMDRKAEKVQKMGRRKSFIASIFGKG
jgi:Mg-chelatase subunit ChlI